LWYQKKILYVDNGNEDTVPSLSVGIQYSETPIATAKMIMGRLGSRLESNYKMVRSSIYDQLNSAIAGWTEEEKQGFIHGSGYRMEGECENEHFGNEKESESEEIVEGDAQNGDIIVEENTSSTNDEVADSTSNSEEELKDKEKEYDWQTDIDDNTIVESPDLNSWDPNKYEPGNVDDKVEEKQNSNKEEVHTEIVCASAKPSFTEGSKFERAKFTIGGTDPQEIKITSSAENFAIVKKYGGLVFQMIDGKSWGSLILEPGSYILSCNGGGAMGLMSASVCIENPSANVPPISPRPGEEDRPILEESKPPLPKGPIEKIFVRPANLDDGNSNHLTMLIGDEKGIAVWGVDAGGNEQNVSVDDWKVYDEDIGWITKGLHNPASKDAPMKIKFKAGNKKGYTRIKATVINEENRRISGVLSIEVTKDPPITVTGCVKLYDENGNPLNAGGVKVNLDATWHENRQAHDQVVNWMEIPRQDKEIKTDRNGNFKFVVAMNGEFVSINCGLRYVLSAPPGYKWDSTPSDKGDFDDAEWKGSVKPGDTIPMVQSSYGCLSNFLKKMPITYYIGGKVIHRGKPVEGAKIKLVSNGKTFEDDKSRYNGQYWLDVGNLPKGTYILTADYKPIDESKEASPENTITLSNWLTMRNKIMVDLPLPTQEETIPINLISWKDKIGYTGP